MGVEWKSRGTVQHCPRGQFLPRGSDTRGNQDGNPHAEQLKAQEQRTSPQRRIRAEPHTGSRAALQSNRELLQPHQVTGDSIIRAPLLKLSCPARGCARTWPGHRLQGRNRPQVLTLTPDTHEHSHMYIGTSLGQGKGISAY